MNKQNTNHITIVTLTTFVLNILFLLTTLAICVRCTDDAASDSNHYGILVRLENECAADIRIFDESGNQIGREYYDCNYISLLPFSLKESGLYVVYADNGKKQIKKPVVVPPNGGEVETTIEF